MNMTGQATVLRVGGLMDPAPPFAEGAHAWFDQNGLTVAFVLPGIDQAEAKYYATRSLSFRFIVGQHSALVLFRFGSFGWCEVPYSLIPLPPDQRFIPNEPAAGAGYPATFVIVDSSTNLIRALRVVGLSNGFSSSFRKALLRQSESTASADDYETEVNSWRSKTTAQLAAMAIDRFEQRGPQSC